MSPFVIPSWLWGVLICISSNVATALGMDVQKFSFLLNEKSEKPLPAYRQKWWLLGFAIFIIGQVMNLVSMSLAPQVMLSALGGTALIANAVFAWMFLGEVLHRIEVVIMSCLIGAMVMVVSTTPAPITPATVDPTLFEIFDPFFTPQWILLFAGVCIILLAVRISVFFCCSDLDPLLWTLCSAVASGYSVNTFRAVSEIIAGWERVHPLLHWQCFVVTVCAICFGVLQVYFLNRALKHKLGDASVVVPTFFSLSVLAQLGLAEMIQPNAPTVPLQVVVWVSGIVLILVFIVALVRVKIWLQHNAEKTPLPVSSAAALATEPIVPSRMKRVSSLSEYDPQAFAASWEGDERSYTSPVVGPLGIA